MNVGDRIKARRLELGLSVDEVATALGKNRATIYRYESNEIENFPTSVLEPLSIVLDTSPAYLMGWTDNIKGFPTAAETSLADDADIIIFDKGKAYDASKLTDKARKDIDELLKGIGAKEYTPTHMIPILGRVAAGLPMYAVQNIEGYTYAELPAGGKYFGLKVKGDSMTAARIFDGDVIIVREQEIVENGEIAVVAVNGDDATVKKFHREGDIITLSPSSFNPEHQVQIYNTKNTDIRVIGKVVLSQTVFE